MSGGAGLDAGYSETVPQLWERARWCGSRWWRRRLRGARLLTTLGGGDEAVPPLLSDPRPEVTLDLPEPMLPA